ncbi:MAG TPA: hypothetical protein VNE83_08990 [Terriglobales bacterium]|nr:hypothetical protein [Terriglobales bacterium]
MQRFHWFLIALAAVCLAGAPIAQAQSIDAFAGLNALTASQAVQNIPRLGGGLFPSAGVSLFLGPVGIGAEAAFRSQQSNSQATGLRPIYYDVNLIFDPIHISRSIVPELMVGVGAQSIQAYSGLTQCGSLNACSTYANANHLTGHVGLALKVYLTEHIFLQPEAHFYFVRHNAAFQAANAQRFGISLGFTFGGG